MYAHIELSKFNSRVGQVVWAECTKEEFEEFQDDDFISVIYPDGFRTDVRKLEINIYSDNRADVEVSAVAKRKEILEKFEKSIFLAILHNEQDMGPSAAFGLETSTYAEVKEMVDYIHTWTKSSETRHTNALASILIQMCTEKNIPVFHVGKVSDTDYFCYWLTTQENQFFGSGIIYLPNKSELRKIMDNTIKLLGIELI